MTSKCVSRSVMKMVKKVKNCMIVREAGGWKEHGREAGRAGDADMRIGMRVYRGVSRRGAPRLC